MNLAFLPETRDAVKDARDLVRSACSGLGWALLTMRTIAPAWDALPAPGTEGEGMAIPTDEDPRAAAAAGEALEEDEDVLWLRRELDLVIVACSRRGS